MLRTAEHACVICAPRCRSAALAAGRGARGHGGGARRRDGLPAGVRGRTARGGRCVGARRVAAGAWRAAARHLGLAAL
eukprot:5212711-Prymnesium_polylepis.3